MEEKDETVVVVDTDPEKRPEVEDSSLGTILKPRGPVGTEDPKPL